ncbi:MAG TPA: nucleotidyltransferase domain-containing protein [Thermoanaerobaculia bacterium]|nr:nucleotidyltransferase domain-containing protein [Thermoanaerobaculia bacterium]
MARPHLILPVGTQVVSRIEIRDSKGKILCPEGAVGVIAKAPADGTHSYLVKLPDGSEVPLRRNNLTIRKHQQREDLEAITAANTEDEELFQSVIYRCVVGSRAYGLEHDESDLDVRGIYLPPADLHWSLYGVPEQIERKDTDEAYWEIQKFLSMALKANPNVLECLYTPVVELCLPPADELIAERSRFLSKMVYQTYNGYVLSQFKKLEQDLRTVGEIRWKHAMHLIRLQLAGIAALTEGRVPVRVDGEFREPLLAIRRNEVPWKEVEAWRLELHEKFDAALASSPLPDRPDYLWANDFLIRARRRMV